MKTSVVILNFNGEEHLKRFLPDVLRRSQGAEVVVADNGSTDGSIAFLEQLSGIRLIRFDQNYGFAEGYNQALRQIEADYYILLNSDVDVSDNWLSPLESYMDAHPEVAACQPKIRSVASPKKFEYAGAAGGFIDSYGYPFCRGRIFGEVETDHGQYDSIIPVFWATGACLMIRSEVYWQAGALDGRFFAHMEEIDLCWRLKARGQAIVCIPQSVVFHVGGGTLLVESPFKTFLNFRNNLLLLYKNLTPEQFKKIIFRRYLLDGVAALRFLLLGHRKNVWQIYRAHQAFRAMKADFTAARDENIRLTTDKNPSGFYHGMVVFDFFARGKKRFSQFDALQTRPNK